MHPALLPIIFTDHDGVLARLSLDERFIGIDQRTIDIDQSAIDILHRFIDPRQRFIEGSGH